MQCLVFRCAIALAVFSFVGFARATIITFDDIPAGLIGDQYLSRGVRFLVGNGTFGTATGLLIEAGQPVSAYAGSYGTSLSQPNVMNAGAFGNSDIYVLFYDGSANRTYASSVAVTNDTDGNPAQINIQGFDVNGGSLGSTAINGASQTGVFSNPGSTSPRSGRRRSRTASSGSTTSRSTSSPSPNPPAPRCSVCASSAG